MGVIDEVGLFTTEMHTFDNIGISMPNSKVWGAEIQNLNRVETRRVDFKIAVAYEEDIERALVLVRGILSQDDRVLFQPELLVDVLVQCEDLVYVVVWRL